MAAVGSLLPLSIPSLLYVLETHIVPTEIQRTRLSDYAVIFKKYPSRKGMKKAIKRGEIYVNDQLGSTGTWVATGDRIECMDLELPPLEAYQLDLEIVYEDAHLAVIQKPSGINVSGNQFRTVENALLHNLKASEEADALRGFRAAHRLDNPTSGLLLVAKTSRARIHLGRQFEAKTIQKRYQAIVIGKAPEQGELTDAIENKTAYTRFERVQVVASLRNTWLSLLNLYPSTGRTHQLRIHLSDFGFPILGDKLYGTEGEILKKKGLFLVAVGLRFEHPISGEQLVFELDTPYKYQALLARETRRWERFHQS